VVAARAVRRGRLVAAPGRRQHGGRREERPPAQATPEARTAPPRSLQAPASEERDSSFESLSTTTDHSWRPRATTLAITSWTQPSAPSPGLGAPHHPSSRQRRPTLPARGPTFVGSAVSGGGSSAASSR
jgi:hypothetical protein